MSPPNAHIVAARSENRIEHKGQHVKRPEGFIEKLSIRLNLRDGGYTKQIK
jgi:hypothetical protein